MDTGYTITPPVARTVTAVLDCNRLVDHDADNTRLTMGEMMIEGDGGVLRLDGNGKIYVRGREPDSERVHMYPWKPLGFGGDCVYVHAMHRSLCTLWLPGPVPLPVTKIGSKL